MLASQFLTLRQTAPRLPAAAQLAAATQLPAALPAAGAGLLIPIGGGYDYAYPAFASALLDQNRSGHIKITLLPASL